MISLRQNDRPSIVNQALVLIFFLGLYLIPFEKHIPVPFLVSFFASIVLLIRRAGSLPARETNIIVLVLVVATLCTVLAPRPEYFIARFKSLSYFSASIMAGLIIYSELRTWPRTLLARWAGFAVLLLLVGAAAESLALPFREASDAYREWNFINVYKADERDIVFHGMVRPKVFGKEPSYLGIFFSLFIISWLFVSRHKHKFALFNIASFIAILLMRTPTLLMTVAASATFLIYHNFAMRKNNMSKSLKFILYVFAAAICIGVFVYPLLGAFGERFVAILEGDDNSAVFRIFGPFILLPEIMKYNYITGVGIGGMEAFEDVIYRAFYFLGPDYLERKLVELGGAERFVHNTLIGFIVSFGAVGTIVIVFLLDRVVLKNFPKGRNLFWILLFLLSNTFGGVNDLRFWAIYFTLLVMGSKGDGRHDLDSGVHQAV